MLKTIVIALLLAAVPVSAASARGAAAFGPRAGFSVGPDQLVLGGQMVVGEIAQNLTFDPSVEVGFGDDLTVLAVNFDMHYHTRVSGTDWRPYFGAGVGVLFIESDRQPPFRDDSETDVSGALILGASVPNQGNKFFTELKLGFSGPDLKIMVGWNFGR